MEKIIGRELEKKELTKTLESKKSELVAVMGRRRVGKTFLVRNHLEPNIILEFTGVQNVSNDVQLFHFMNVLKAGGFVNNIDLHPKSWLEAFGFFATIFV